jgi:hypothetical protein
LPIYHRVNYIGALARTSRGSVMKIVFSRWVGVDSVAPAPDYLDRQSADCGGASRFYRRGVAVRVSKTARTVSIAHLGDADPDLTTNHWHSP